MLSCEICKTFGNTFFHRTSPVTAFVFLKQKSNNEKIYSHEHIRRETPVMVSFLVQLQPWGLIISRKRESSLGTVHMRWAGPATWAGSARWGDFHPAFIWNFLSHCKKLVASLVLVTWLLSRKIDIFNMYSNNFIRLQQFHFTVYSIMNTITAFSILLQLYGILLVLVLLILDFIYLVVLVVASLKSNLERFLKHTHAL